MSEKTLVTDPEPNDAPDESNGTIWRDGPRFIASDRMLARYLARPVAEFLRVEAAAGVALVASAVIAMVWANSPWADAYQTLWHTPISVSFGSMDMSGDVQHWINDALMVIFFFVVGLEIKYELVGGHLRDPRAACVPIIAAVGGMIVPASIYWVVAGSGEGAAGWGIPMATDIAFAVGVLALLGRRIPPAARIFLLTLAIADDVGAILVIAVFYTADLSLGWLIAAALVFVAIGALRRLRVWSIPIYVIVGIAAWFATYQSGVHATIAGVILGLLTPARPLLQESQARRWVKQSLEDNTISQDELHRLRFLLHESVPVVARLQAALLSVSGFVVLPLFALANAGIRLDGDVLGDALRSDITLGVAAGLLLGKVAGITLATWLAVRSGLGRLPAATSWPIMVGLGMVGGIGFTVSLFISGLSFPDADHLMDEAKVGIFVASILAAILGSLILLAVTRSPSRKEQGYRS